MKSFATRRSEFVGHDSGLRLVAPPVSEQLTFEVLGRFSARIDVHRGDPAAPDLAGSRRCEWSRPLVGRVIRFLLVHRASSVCEERLFEAFWPGKDPQVARRSLAVVLSMARSDFGLAARDNALIISQERRHQLVLEPGDRIDAEQFEQAAASALAEPMLFPTRRLEYAASLWAGDPLPQDRHADWAQGWRDALTQRFGEVLGALSDAYDHAGRSEDAVRSARARVELDPLDELAQRGLITAYARAGRRAPALAQFMECRRLLTETVGIEPCEQTRDLHRRVLEGVAV